MMEFLKCDSNLMALDYLTASTNLLCYRYHKCKMLFQYSFFISSALLLGCEVGTFMYKEQ